MQRAIASGLQAHMQKRRHALPRRRHHAYKLLGHVRRLDGGKAYALDAGLPEHALDEAGQLVGALRILATEVAEVDAGQHHLVRPAGLCRAHLFEHLLGGNGPRRPACLPDDAERAAVVAPVLNLDAGARAPRRRGARNEMRRCWLGGVGIGTRSLGQKPERAFCHLALVGLHDGTRSGRHKLVGKKARHAARCHNDGRLRQPRRMTHRLARLGLGLARDGAGVDDDSVGLALADNLTSRLLELQRHRVELDAVDAAPQVYERHAPGASACARHACAPRALCGASGAPHVRHRSGRRA